MSARYHCLDLERRARVARSPLNGIDFLEVLDREAPTEALRQRLLVVRCLKGVTGVGVANVRIEGGTRITGIGLRWVFPLTASAAELAGLTAAEREVFSDYRAGAADRDQYLVVATDSEGDFTRYRLVLHAAGETLPGFDSRLSSIEFSFKVECPTDFDCAPVDDCPPEDAEEPPIDYLAKDYASFRRLMLDRLAVLTPEWTERSPADLGVALVELLAYVGDRLSYYQDAVATEAYLGTARRRISIRRHARQVGYAMHEGLNARAWVHVRVHAAAEGAVLRGPDAATGAPGTALATRFSDQVVLPSHAVEEALDAGAEVFETLHEVTLRVAQNQIPFYTWSDLECCLPVGATEATLRTPPVPGLEPGAFLLFEEVLGPRTGASGDADPEHRHVVRLTRVTETSDPLDDTEVVEIEWDAADALPFPLCISSRTDDSHGAVLVENVSVARGNLVLADHGLTLAPEALEPVPDDAESFAPVLAAGSLVHAAPLAEELLGDTEPGARRAPASAALEQSPERGVPAVALIESPQGTLWRPQRDLLASDRFASEFVAEIDDEGHAHLRFGDDVYGKRPAAGTEFGARYRVGGGTAGNVGAEAIGALFADQVGIVGVRNPLAATGGAEPESVAEVRRFAPRAFRRQERAVTEDDYARVAERHPEVQKAAATFRWTGSWHTVFITVDRLGGRVVDEAFELRLRDFLERFRMAGHDLEIDGPRFVALDLALSVCAEPGYQAADLRRELAEVLSNRALAPGRLGFFHPDAWTFGQPVYLSRIYEAASAVEGVESVEVTRFDRWGQVPDPSHLDTGVLEIDRLEIARLDNDPSFQENGRLEIHVGGGR